MPDVVPHFDVAFDVINDEVAERLAVVTGAWEHQMASHLHRSKHNRSRKYSLLQEFRTNIIIAPTAATGCVVTVRL